MATRSEKTFHKVETIVEKVLIQHQLQDLLHFSKILKHWDVVVGAPLAQKAAPEKLRRKTLHIRVVDAAYAHHLRFYERQLLDLIASPEICGEGVVSRIVFKVGLEISAVQPAKAGQAAPATRPLNATETVAPEISQTSERIQDQTLRRAFTRFMQHLKSRPTDRSG